MRRRMDIGIMLGGISFGMERGELWEGLETE